MASRTRKRTPLVPAPSETLIRAHFTKPEHRFFNREISWLSFNTRVLEEAMNPHLPLLERVRFLSISAANLDEFYMVRVAGLKDNLDQGIHTPSPDGLTTKQQLDRVNEAAAALIHKQQQCWIHLQKLLAKEQIRIITAKDLSRSDKVWLRSYFEKNIFPILTPIAVDPAHPFPFVPNLGIVQLYALQPPKKKSKKMLAMVQFPPTQGRFVKLETGKGTRFMLLGDVIELFIDLLFPKYTLLNAGVFRIVRDSDVEVEEEAEDLMRYLDKAVKQRRYGRIVRLKASKGATAELIKFMCEHLPAEREDVIEIEGMVGLAQVSEIYDTPRPDLKFSPFKVRFPERINDYGGDCFAAIEAKDIVIHHPYESFDVVVKFIEQAAADPNVISIKQTLYRTSADSPIVKALIRAAESGKTVTALVELKARFDEEANMRWARDMERAGVQVVFGFVNMKTHAKVSLVVRRVGKTMKTYAHFGTGNYHPNTAKVYADLSFFTCNPDLCQDAGYVFNYVTGYAKPLTFKKLGVAPLHMRNKLYKLIREEMAHARAGRPAAIWAKMNSLIDPEMIDALYAASQAGVQIELVVRGICGIKPGIKGFSENIRVRSMVGRFLEHGRMVAFGAGHGLPSPKAKLFISSADWMTRNLDRRIELLIPITNTTVHAQILDQIFVANLKDERQSWVLSANGEYHRITNDPNAFAAHDYFMTNPSLSGRGKALQKIGQPETPIAAAAKKKKRN
ncbi:MAG: RNA degradosome polyphosphate kinase [Alphaproteobacteria bacterium]|nr:RNA degradosome polyphosphate kinase [Alphaproteobacteria bacterium]